MQNALMSLMKSTSAFPRMQSTARSEPSACSEPSVVQRIATLPTLHTQRRKGPCRMVTLLQVVGTSGQSRTQRRKGAKGRAGRALPYPNPTRTHGSTPPTPFFWLLQPGLCPFLAAQQQCPGVTQKRDGLLAGDEAANPIGMGCVGFSTSSKNPHTPQTLMVNAVLVVETLRATSLPPHLFVVFVVFVVPARTLPSESPQRGGFELKGVYFVMGIPITIAQMPAAGVCLVGKPQPRRRIYPFQGGLRSLLSRKTPLSFAGFLPIAVFSDIEKIAI